MLCSFYSLTCTYSRNSGHVWILHSALCSLAQNCSFFFETQNCSLRQSDLQCGSKGVYISIYSLVHQLCCSYPKHQVKSIHIIPQQCSIKVTRTASTSNLLVHKYTPCYLTCILAIIGQQLKCPLLTSHAQVIRNRTPTMSYIHNDD